jgi:hypothetical protein
MFRQQNGMVLDAIALGAAVGHARFLQPKISVNAL